MSACRGLALVAALQAAAFWPVWRWTQSRMADGSDEPWGLAAVAAAGLIVVLRARERGAPPVALEPVLAWATAGTLVYAAACPWAPPLVRAVLAAAALGATLAAAGPARGARLSLVGLAALSVPVVSSMQFYLGYPLRRVTGELAAGLLRTGGFAVVADGTMLRWEGALVAIDAPCSGVRMLWGALWLAFTLAGLLGLGQGRSLALAVLALPAVVLANALRSASLFFPEVGLVHGPAATHAGAGLACFLLMASALAAAAWRLQEAAPCA